jgi:hypothetical protein
MVDYVKLAHKINVILPKFTQSAAHLQKNAPHHGIGSAELLGA